MDPSSIRIADGGAEGRGSRFDGAGVHFAVYSAYATKIELCLFDDSGTTETARIPLPGHQDNVFHGYLPNLKPGQLYGFRAHGAFDPANGHRFNPNKLLLDPYAKEIAGEVIWGDALTDPAQDSAAAVPKSRVVSPLPPLKNKKPDLPQTEAVILEAHPKGQTITDPRIPADLRGTIKGLAHPAATGRLQHIGINALELMPVHSKLHDDWLTAAGKKNYWGYNTLGFFSVSPEYLKTGKREEFREMVETLHEKGIEVYLDVVYNHTAEGGHNGATLSFRGLDNASYYRLSHDKRYYHDETGCGNTLDFTNPEVRRMTIDSLRYWAEEMGVDGFRFDLAPILGHTAQGFDRNAPLFKEIEADPVLSKVKMIAEPWGPFEMQLGNFPARWGEWNCGFRDDLRRYWRGDAGTSGALATRLAGSHPVFPQRAPTTSINFIACHDGMTLHDIVSHSFKKNLANGEDNRDGSNDNHSYNHGAEGATQNPAIIALREQQKRNMLATLFLAQGTPMLLAGDEHGNTQNGNNNTFCQDNETGWLNRDKITHEGKRLTAFVRKLAAFRKEHPVLRAEHHLHGTKTCPHGTPDISWINPSGQIKNGAGDWQGSTNNCFGMLLNESTAACGTRLLAVFNNRAEQVSFTLPEVPCRNTGWQRVLDTAEPQLKKDPALHPAGSSFAAAMKSVTVFELKR